jgi:Flp pilus assembly protein TadG
MKTKLSRFCRDEAGYVATLTLISMPLLLGVSLMIVDASRGNNLHTDLQNAVDAIALAGARELDGGADAIDRAEAAMTDLLQNQARMGDNGSIVIDADQVEWLYFQNIPDNDDEPMDPEADTSDDASAAYVWVWSKEQPMTTLFPLPASWTTPTVTVAADAVATYQVGACDVTPMFICNPFEGQDLSLEEAFAEGQTYSREFRVLKTSSRPGPGNFGLLDTEIPLRTAFATGTSGTCFQQGAVTTKTGVTLGHVNAGLNVRFDVYSGSLKSFDSNSDYRPAVNVRKGAKDTSGNAGCSKFQSDDPSKAMGFPEGSGYDSSTGMSSSSWDRCAYWTLNHTTPCSTATSIPSTTHPTSTSEPPSRYDVYNYEIANNLVADKAGNKSNGENGVPRCYGGASNTLTTVPDRRVIFAAVVNCGEHDVSGKVTLEADAFVSIFLTNPIEKEDNSKDDEDTSAAEKPIRFEIVDVTGNSGNGTLDTFLRQEAQLVR